MENNEENIQNEVVSIELPAPPGWIKRFTPKKGGTPRRHDVLFTAPTGEEIKSKRQLELYLKSHAGGPSAAEFDWGTGNTPRRSTRLSEKSKALELPEIETPKKKQKKTSAKKGEKEKNDSDEGEASADKDVIAKETGGPEICMANAEKEKNDADGGEANDGKDASAEKTKGGPEVCTSDAENAGHHDGGEFIAEGALPYEHKIEETAQESKEGEVVKEETPPVKVQNDATTAGSNEGDVVKDTPVVEIPNYATTGNADAKVEEPEDATAESANETGEELKDRVDEVADLKIEEPKGEDHAEKGTSSEKVDSAVAVAADNGKKENLEAEKTTENDSVLKGGTGGDYSFSS